jgi:hypothetical protein
MFGDRWEPATATIVAKQWKTGGIESGSIYEFVAQARFDVSDPSLSTKHAFDAEKDRFEATKAGPVGSTTESADVLAGEDPRLHLIRVRIKTATVQNNLDEVERLTEMMRKVEAGELPMPGAAPAAPAVDPLDRLKKLADLHAAGALTDEEFAEQKAKILEQT